MKEIAISGNDGVGKTEQISLLGYSHNDQLYFTGNLGSYSDRWPKLGPVEEFNWWFKEVPFPELSSMIIDSLNARHRSCKPDKVNIHDRGVKMFKVACTATLMVREQTDTEKAISIVEEMFEQGLEFPPTEQDLLLVPNQEYKEKTRVLLEAIENRAGSYLPWQNCIYTEYQEHLTTLVNHFFRNIHTERMVRVDACIIEVQNRLRTLISTIFSSQIVPLCNNLQKVVAFGGLSECGKSSFAQRLSSNCGYTRLKLKYFDQVAKLRYPEPTQKDVGREILIFLQSHSHIIKASLESLHGVGLPVYLKLLLGDRISIVYLDTSRDLRVLRTVKSLGVSEHEVAASTIKKDKEKISRGADKVKGIADIVFNNDDSNFEKSFDRFVRNL